MPCDKQCFASRTSLLQPPATENRDLSAGSGTTPVTTGPQKLNREGRCLSACGLLQGLPADSISPCCVPPVHAYVFMAPRCGVFGARHVLSSQQSAENFAQRGQAHLVIRLKYLGRVTSSRSFVARVSGSRELGLVSPPRTIPTTLHRHSLVLCEVSWVRLQVADRQSQDPKRRDCSHLGS